MILKLLMVVAIFEVIGGPNHINYIVAATTDITSFRLPNTSIPLHYNLSLTTDIHDNATSAFSGRILITIKVVEDTSVITLHYRQHTIDQINLYNYSKDPIQPPLIEKNIAPTLVKDFEFLQIRTAAPLLVDRQYIVEIFFNNTLRDDNSGFYRSFYNTTKGETKWLAATQFEVTGARHAFPCYDEPGLRATFTIEIKHHMTYNAISNWPVDSITPEIGTNKYITKFQRTFPMPTYLVAFIVSDFMFIEQGNQRVYAKAESVKSGEADFALQAGIKIMQVCEKLWGLYTLPKVYNVALPDFFAYGMEEWGLLTYREEEFLYNNQTATLRNKEAVLRLMSHEFTHLWFGDLVSLSWWNVLWVKEAFGQFNAMYLNSLIYPDDRWMDAFVVDTTHKAFTIDAHPNTRPLTYHANTPTELTALFDSVAYDKAASVIWMMQNAVGNTTFNKGLRYYLETSTHQSVGSAKLYAGIQRSIDEDFPTAERLDFADIMRSWEFQSGYPCVTVNREGNQLIFKQERFFYTDDVSESIWWIPINYVTESNPNFQSTLPKFWMKGVPSVSIPNSDTLDWIVVNIQQTGYYRVNYDNYLWNLLQVKLNSLNFIDIHVLNRAQLVDDSLNLAQTNKIDYEIAFGILSYLSQETDHIPWDAAKRSIILLNRWLASTDVYENYKLFVRQLVEPLLSHLGFDIISGEHRMNRFARTNAINLACEAGSDLCLSQTAATFEQVLNGKDIAPDMQSAVFCQGIRQGNITHFKFLHNKMRNSNNQAERTLLQLALGCSQDSKLLTEYLKTAFTNELRLSEKKSVLVVPQDNGELGLRVMIDLIRSNYDDIINVGIDQVNTMLTNIAARVSSEQFYHEFDLLLKDLNNLKRITEVDVNNFRLSARTNLNWQEINLVEIRKWLQGNKDKQTSTKKFLL